MIIPSIIFTSSDLSVPTEKIENLLSQESIVSNLRTYAMRVLYSVFIALYKINDGEYLVIKCYEEEFVGRIIGKMRATELLRKYTSKLTEDLRF